MWTLGAPFVGQADLQEAVAANPWPSQLRPEWLGQSVFIFSVTRKLPPIIFLYTFLQLRLSFFISMICRFLAQILGPCLNWSSALPTWFFVAYPACPCGWPLLMPVSGLLLGADSWPASDLTQLGHTNYCGPMTSFISDHSLDFGLWLQVPSATIFHFSNLHFSALLPTALQNVWHQDTSQLFTQMAWRVGF